MASVGRVVPSWVLRAKKGTTGKRTGLKHGFRSGLEVNIGATIEAMGEPVVYEEHRLEYLVPASRHHYTADFILKNGIVLEGKGIFDSTDRAKHLFVKTQYPELDIRFVFSNPNASIGNGSKTTLAMWCQKYGYKYSHKVPPKAWFLEPGPAKHPVEVLKAGPYAYLKEYPKGYTLP